MDLSLLVLEKGLSTGKAHIDVGNTVSQVEIKEAAAAAVRASQALWIRGVAIVPMPGQSPNSFALR